MSATALKTPKRGATISVAAFLEQQIALSGKSQREIATEVGYANPNVITMIKQGHTKLPINRVRPMAVALGLDPRYLLRVVMTEYMPETWDVITELMGDDLGVTQEELAVVKTIRAVSKGRVPTLTAENRHALEETIKALISRDEANTKSFLADLSATSKRASKK